MSRKRPEAINLENIFDLMTSHFGVMYGELLKVLRDEKNYKRMLKMGEKQFFEAPTASSIEIESQKSKLCMAKINLLAVEVDNDIDRIIQEKLQGDFLNTFKEEVLKAVLDLSKQKSSTQVLVSSSKSPTDQKKNEENLLLKHIKDLSKYCAQNMNDIRKQVGESSVEGAEPSDSDKRKKIIPSTSVKEIIDIDNSDPDLGNMSFGSVSSVHTSDLSSFDDEISLSSDEESGIQGKRLSLTEAQEKMERLKAKKLENMKDDQQIENPEPAVVVKSEYPVNGSPSVSQKSQRVRKPNSKYISDDVTSSLKRKSTEKTPSNNISTSSRALSVDDSVPRKRGRPRKYLT